ncbi:hypothetical protein MKW98_026591 [Papaver atlanticum]|uniref:Uncharacterized protein n=1 Tax=Papaver atlanticum TaxID=357466 RepID=A0AAD4X5D7_9MAGN|nr:hypothetical protein MKW98_026591 [Papaver atlanticum]
MFWGYIDKLTFYLLAVLNTGDVNFGSGSAQGLEYEGDVPIIISCASLAQADAGGIMMYDLVTLVSVSCLGSNLVIDPITEESYQDGGRLICNVSYTTFSFTIRGQGSDIKEFSSMRHKL